MPTETNKNVEMKGHQYVLMTDDRHPPTLERRAFVEGLFNELQDQLERYLHLVQQLADLRGRMMIVERNLRLSRDHVKAVLSQTEEEVPDDWQTTLDKVRFVGARLGDACVQILKEHETLTTQQLLDELNLGQFRFRTSSPLREINAALLRQPQIQREDDRWVYRGHGTEPPKEEVA